MFVLFSYATHFRRFLALSISVSFSLSLFQSFPPYLFSFRGSLWWLFYADVPHTYTHLPFLLCSFCFTYFALIYDEHFIYLYCTIKIIKKNNVTHNMCAHKFHSFFLLSNIAAAAAATAERIRTVRVQENCQNCLLCEHRHFICFFRFVINFYVVGHS